MGELFRAASTAATIAVFACFAPGCGAKVGVATTDSGATGAAAAGSAGGGSAGEGGAAASGGAGAGAGTGGVTSTGAAAGEGGGGGGQVVCASDNLGRPLALHAGGAGYTLAPPERIEVFQDFYSQILVGDVTGDGRADILGSEIDHAALYAQSKDGSLAAPVMIAHDWYNPGSAALLHAGADDILDFAIINENGLEILPSLGGGAFGPPVLLADHYGYNLVVTDLDADGDEDLVWQAYGDVAYSYGDGTGSFNEPVILAPSPKQIAGLFLAGDMTGDMRSDFASFGYPSFTSLVVIPHDGTSAPSAGGWVDVPLSGKPFSGAATGDVNGDGLVDVVWQDEDNGDYDVRTYVMLAQPGGFAAPAEIAKNGWGGPVTIADVNADGLNDVVILHTGAFSLTVVLSTPGGMAPFQDYDFPTAASVGYGLAVADVNCDGCPDVVANDVGGLDVFYGKGCGQ